MPGVAIGCGRVELHQGGTGVDLFVGAGQQAPHAPRERRWHCRLHLHALDDRDRRAGRHVLAGADRDGDDHTRSRGSHDALVVAAEAVRCAVDLDEMFVALHRRHDPCRPRSQVQASLEGSQRLESDHRRHSAELDVVRARAQAVDVHPVRVAAVKELDGAADLGRRARTSPARRREEAGLVHVAFRLVGVDRGDQEGEVGVTFDGDLALSGDAVDERIVDPRLAHLGPGEDVEEEPLVRAPAIDHDRRLVESAPQPDPCLVP